jgi:uncharacterized protein YdhG (YjbR/CyaY superfamily)
VSGGAAEQGDEADEAFGGTNPRAASGAAAEGAASCPRRLGWTRAPLRSLSPVFDGPGGPAWQARLGVGGDVARRDVGVDAYIAKQATEAQRALRRVRSVIRRVLPAAEETISYQIPAYRLRGQYVVYFAGWKKHWSLYPVTEPIRQELGAALSPYELSKGTVRFPLVEPVPIKLVERIVKALAGAAAGRSREKARTRSRQADQRRRTRG